MAAARSEPRKKGFWPLAILFTAFVLFLYGPVITIFVLSFQGPEGGLTFPMRGVSLHWYAKLWQGLGPLEAEDEDGDDRAVEEQHERSEQDRQGPEALLARLGTRGCHVRARAAGRPVD